MMNWIDLAILIVIIVFVTEGQKRGFFIQAVDIIGFLISLILALVFYSQAAQLLTGVFDLPVIAANPIGFLLVWIIVEITFFSVFGGLIAKFVTKFAPTSFNKFLGFAPAAANALLFLAFILLLIVSLPIRPNIKKNIYDSKIGSQLIEKASVLERPLGSIFGPVAKRSLTFLTIRPEEKESIPLEFTQNVLTVDSQSELIMFELVNKERINQNIPALIWDESLANVGRNHSRDMFERGYFSHFSPEDKDVGDRLQNADINYRIAGENLALAPNVNRAHTGLMNSPGHRRNILDPAFDRVGIGVIDGGVYGKMFVQVFTD